MKEKIIIIGGGGHAKCIIDMVTRMKIYKIEAIITKEATKERKIYNIPVYNGDDAIKEFYNRKIRKAIIGIGGFKDNKLRTSVYERIKAMKFELINVIDPTAYISKTVKMGNGNVIFPGVILDTEVKIGNNIIIGTASSIDHETIIEDNVLISAGVTIGGYAHIKRGSLVALGAKIVSGGNVGKNSLVAAGAVVVNEVGDNQKVYGVPAKPLKINT